MQVCQARERYVRWLLTTRELSVHTIRAYESDITALEGFLGSRSSVEDIRRERLLDFVEEQRNAGLAARSIRRRTSGLRGFCAWLQASHLIEFDPWSGITLSLGRTR